MKRLGSRGVTLLELMAVTVVLGILALIGDRWIQGYQLTARLQNATEMVVADIRRARLDVRVWGEPYRIDFEPKTTSYLVNGVSRINLPAGISFGASPDVTGRPSDPHERPPKDGISFRGEGTENRAEFFPKGIVAPTGAVYLTNGRETIAITVTVNGHTTAWRSEGGSKWAEI